MIVLGEQFATAVHYASTVHASQMRKGTQVPYMAHLLGVASLVLEAGGDEELAIAGLLHDAAEDHGGEVRLADIGDRFGQRVASIVRDCSDSLSADPLDKADWETRKREHLAHIPDMSDDALLVWMADKAHNARSIVTDLQASGLQAMSRFNAPADRILWYYRANLEAGRDRQMPDAVMLPLESAVTELIAWLASSQSG